MITDELDLKLAIERGEPLKTTICEHCGKEFQQWKYGKKRYCCSKCRGHNSKRALIAPSIKFKEPVREWLEEHARPKFASLQIIYLDLKEEGKTYEYGQDYSKHMIRIVLRQSGYEPYNPRVFVRIDNEVAAS